jgi:hypothetical protein
MVKEWIKQLKAGDKVIYYPAYGLPSIKTVTAITKTGFIKIHNALFKDDGFVRGGDAWNRACIGEYTEEIGKRVEEAVKKKNLLDLFRASMNSSKFEMLSVEQLEQINDIIDNGQERID